MIEGIRIQRQGGLPMKCELLDRFGRKIDELPVLGYTLQQGADDPGHLLLKIDARRLRVEDRP